MRDRREWAFEASSTRTARRQGEEHCGWKCLPARGRIGRAGLGGCKRRHAGQRGRIRQPLLGARHKWVIKTRAPYIYLRLVVVASASGPSHQPTLHHAERGRCGRRSRRISPGRDFAVLVEPVGFGDLDRSRGFASRRFDQAGGLLLAGRHIRKVAAICSKFGLKIPQWITEGVSPSSSGHRPSLALAEWCRCPEPGWAVCCPFGFAVTLPTTTWRFCLFPNTIRSQVYFCTPTSSP